MDMIEAATLGAVQGLGEFLPISSSGHLIIVPWLLGWEEHSQTFDVALHMGTLVALLVYFWRDWWRLAMAWLPTVADHAQPSWGVLVAVAPIVALPAKCMRSVAARN